MHWCSVEDTFGEMWIGSWVSFCNKQFSIDIFSANLNSLTFPPPPPPPPPPLCLRTVPELLSKLLNSSYDWLGCRQGLTKQYSFCQNWLNCQKCLSQVLEAQ